MKVTSHALLTLLAVALLRIALDVSYYLFIAPNFAYTGMVLNADFWRYLFSWVVLIVVTMPFLTRKGGLSKEILFALFVTGFVPLTSFYSMAGIEHQWLLLSAAFWLTVFISSKVRLPPPKAPRPASYVPVIWIVLGLAAATLALLSMRFGISLRLNFDDVYEIRAVNKETAIPLGGYIVPWSARIAVPVLAIIALQIRGMGGWMILLAALLAELMFFSITGHKAYFFSIIFIAGLYVLARAKHKIPLIAGGCFLIVLGCMAIDSASGDYYMSSLITRRVFFVPAMLSDVYFRFFDGNFMYLSHSFLSPWIENPLHMSPSMAIGQQYFGVIDLNANNGVVADGFMNFGVFGMFFWAVMLGVTVSMFNALAQPVDDRISFPIAVNTFNTFVNGAFFTSLLTHGVLFAALILMLCPKGELPRLRNIRMALRSHRGVDSV
jgi:hypothetical protein